MKHSWKVSTVTEAFMTYINESNGINRDKITFLPNGADTNFLKSVPPNHDLLSKWDIRNKKIFLYVGTHAFYHGLDVIIETASLLKNNEEILFLMIGDGPERKRIIKKAKDLNLRNIKFKQSPYSEMAELYSITYASIACLKNITVANQMRLSKIFPSLSCEVPVIYSGKGEAANIISLNKCGITVEPENPPELAKAILSISENENYRNELGKAGRNMVKTSYSWEIIIDKWIKQLT
jgi:glycosyltransferase involved in cell wall biosynthesis